MCSGYYRWRLIERANAPPAHVLRLPRSEIEASIYQKGAVVLESAIPWRSIGRIGDPINWDLVPWIADDFLRQAEQTVDLLRKSLADGTPKAKVRSPPRLRKFLNVYVTSVIRCLGLF